VSAAGLDLAFDDAQQALADTVARWCRERFPAEAARAAGERFPDALWRELAGLGVLGLATSEGGGGALEATAAMEALGAAAFPGPLAATFLAAQLLPAAERRAVTSGEALVCVAEPPLLPWAPRAGVFVELAGDEAWRARPAGAIEPMATLGGEPWGRGALAREALLGDARRARALGDLALAAWLAAAGRALVEAAAAHARTRRQFGRPLGAFQAVAHPLAAAAIELDAASTLARVGAWRWDEALATAAAAAGVARLAAAEAALRAVHAAHQAFGALGITKDGPAWAVSRRIRQAVATPPGPAPARAAVLAALDAGGDPG
jgi:alkylation response protein AidB-like acyl-CoA dehydrogenase